MRCEGESEVSRAREFGSRRRWRALESPCRVTVATPRETVTGGNDDRRSSSVARRVFEVMLGVDPSRLRRRSRRVEPSSIGLGHIEMFGAFTQMCRLPCVRALCNRAAIVMLFDAFALPY